MIPTHGTTRSWVPLCPFLMSIHDVAFIVSDRTMYFIFYLVEVTQTIHIIAIILLHIVHQVIEVLLLLSPLPHLLHDHIQYIVQPIIHRPLDMSSKGSNLGSHVFNSADI
jgi:hypothetical protein